MQTRPHADVIHGHFPHTLPFSIYNCIQDIIAGEASLEDLASMIQQYDNVALDFAIDVSNITGPTEHSFFGTIKRTYAGKNITPLIYAFLTGRVDVFSMILAAGANLDNEFNFQCTSMDPSSNEDSKTQSTICNLLTMRQHGVVENFCTDEMRRELFLGLLQRQKLGEAWSLFTTQLKSLEGRSEFFQQAAKQAAAHAAFNHLPSLEKLKKAMESMPYSYREFLCQFRMKINGLISLVKDNYFSRLSAEGTQTTVEILDRYEDCFIDIIANLDKQIKLDQWRVAYSATLFNEFRNYNNERKKHDYLAEIRSHISYVCQRLCHANDSAITVLNTILSSARSLPFQPDTLYYEAMHEYIEDKLNKFAQGNKAVMDLIEKLPPMTRPITKDQLVDRIDKALSHLEQYPLRSTNALL